MTTKINRPNPFVTVWAEKAEKINDKDYSVQETSEAALAIHPARASMDLGFPPITMKSAMRGGQPPWGQDHNAILNRITQSLQWIQAGGTAIFDKSLCDKIGGYPKGAIVQDENDSTTLWFSIVDNNDFDPKDATEKREDFWKKLSVGGGCDQDFSANTMTAKKYAFCGSNAETCITEEADNSITDEPSSITEEIDITKWSDSPQTMDNFAFYTGLCYKFFAGKVRTAKLSKEGYYQKHVVTPNGKYVINPDNTPKVEIIVDKDNKPVTSAVNIPEADSKKYI